MLGCGVTVLVVGLVGLFEGAVVGGDAVEGPFDGEWDGSEVKGFIGEWVGEIDGPFEGILLGLFEGDWLGLAVGFV